MFINAGSKFQYNQQAPTDICLLVPTFGKVGYKKFFAPSARKSCFVPPTLKSAAPPLNKNNTLPLLMSL